MAHGPVRWSDDVDFASVDTKLCPGDSRPSARRWPRISARQSVPLVHCLPHEHYQERVLIEIGVERIVA